MLSYKTEYETQYKQECEMSYREACDPAYKTGLQANVQDSEKQIIREFQVMFIYFSACVLVKAEINS